MSTGNTNTKITSLLITAALMLGLFVGMPITAGAAPLGLSTPSNPHWDADTGYGVWDSVPNSGSKNWHTGSYMYRLYYTGDTPNSPNPDSTDWFDYGNINTNRTGSTFRCNFSSYFTKGNGYYYFAVSALGDGTNYTQSGYAVSDAFYFSGTTAPALPKPKGLKWAVDNDFDDGCEEYIAAFSNLDDYVDEDSISAICYIKVSDHYEQLERNTWTKLDILEYMESYGIGGIPLLNSDNEDGEYYFTVQVHSSRPNEFQSSPEPKVPDDLSPSLTIPIPAPTPPPTTNPGGGSGSSSGSSSGYSGTSTSRRYASDSTANPFSSSGTTSPATQTSNTIRNLANTAKTNGQSIATSKGTGEVTVQASAWSQLSGLSFQHDTIVNGAVQVRITISNPASIAQDLKVSGYVTGPDVERVGNFFGKHFNNTMRVMHFDQTGSWGQEVRIGAKLDLTGMDTGNLVFYAYDKASNTYTQIENPKYSIASNGYVFFSTQYAGSIIISDGPLVKN